MYFELVARSLAAFFQSTPIQIVYGLFIILLILHRKRLKYAKRSLIISLIYPVLLPFILLLSGVILDSIGIAYKSDQSFAERLTQYGWLRYPIDSSVILDLVLIIVMVVKHRQLRWLLATFLCPLISDN